MYFLRQCVEKGGRRVGGGRRRHCTWPCTGAPEPAQTRALIVAGHVRTHWRGTYTACQLKVRYFLW